MGYCGEQSLSTTDGLVKTAVSIRCRSWGCADCAPQRQRELIAKAMDGEPNRLVTLTSRHVKGGKKEHAARRIVESWRRIRRKLMTGKPPQKIEFLAIFEATKTGWPHLHILIRGPWIDQHWLSSEMKKMTDSPITDIRAIHNKRGAAKYVAKYTAKGPARFGTLKRYWTSKHYETSNYEKKPCTTQWDRQEMTLEKWCNAFRELGWHVERLSQWKAQARAPP